MSKLAGITPWTITATSPQCEMSASLRSSTYKGTTPSNARFRLDLIGLIALFQEELVTNVSWGETARRTLKNER